MRMVPDDPAVNRNSLTVLLVLNKAVRGIYLSARTGQRCAAEQYDENIVTTQNGEQKPGISVLVHERSERSSIVRRFSHFSSAPPLVHDKDALGDGLGVVLELGGEPEASRGLESRRRSFVTMAMEMVIRGKFISTPCLVFP